MKWYQQLTWSFLKLTYGLFCKFFYKLTTTEEAPEPEEPFILLANHSYHTDAFYIATGLKKPLRYLASDENASIGQQILGKLVGIIYTQKGTIDPKAVREMLKTVKNGDNIAIYPEGDGTWDGATDQIHMNIIKLVRRFKRPIRLACVTGGYLARPKWAKTGRRGRISISFTTITTQEIAAMSDNDLYNAITNYISNDDIKVNLAEQNYFKGSRLAEGVQHVLWKCPICGAVDTIHGHHNWISCNECCNSWKISSNLEISPVINHIHDLKEWSDWQKDEISDMIDNGTYLLSQSDDIELLQISGKGKGFDTRRLITESIGHGALTLTTDDLYFYSKENDGVTIFTMADISGFVDCLNRYSRFTYNGKQYMIRFKGKNASRYQIILRMLQQNVDAALNRAV